MSNSLIRKITKGSKQSTQRYYKLPQDKQNKKCNGQNEKSGRHRNDHSIQVKSPIKVPINTVRRGDLTFRNRTETYNIVYGSQTAPVKLTQTLHTQLNESLSRESMKINLKTLEVPNGKIKRFVSDMQAKLIDKLWSICTKLISYDNQYTQNNLCKIQLEIKKMLTLLAEQNIYDEAPLASSKKIDLQNCLAYSQCEKQIDHKEFQSSHEDESSINVEIDAESENIQEVYSGKTIKTQSVSFQSPKIQSQTTKNSENTKNIQVKKIMYMLDGKTKNNENIPSKIEPVLLSGNKQSYQSLSSFNQYSNDDSGFTVFEIQRCSQRTSQYSKQGEQNDLNIQQLPIKFNKKCHRESQGKKLYEKRSQTQIRQPISQRSQQLQQTSNIKIGSKRKVLNDIVTMLNHKYNKNIRLQ